MGGTKPAPVVSAPAPVEVKKEVDPAEALKRRRTAESRTDIKDTESGAGVPRECVVFTKGDNVRIIDGPFMGFNGLVDDVDEDHSRVKALVSIFGRSTPVELAFSQIERG